jgi:hypothetical protein
MLLLIHTMEGWDQSIMSTGPISDSCSPSKNKNYYIVDMILKSIINQRSSTRPNLFELKSCLFLAILLIHTSVNLCVRVLRSSLCVSTRLRTQRSLGLHTRLYTTCNIDASHQMNHPTIYHDRAGYTRLYYNTYLCGT